MTHVLASERDRWLAARRELVTASDAAAILGMDPRRGALSVYAAKLGALDEAETDWMAFGRDVEGAIAKGYSRRSGRSTMDLGALEIQRHPDAPWLGATLDRLTSDSTEHPRPEGVQPGSLVASDGVPLEAKAVGAGKAREWKADPPLYFQTQLQIQLACTGAQWGALVALVGGLQIVWRDLVRNDRFLRVALPKLEEFHLRVLRRDPPPADALATTRKALAALWPTDDGSTLELDSADRVLVEEWESALSRQNDARKAVRLAVNRLRRRMGAATFGELPAEPGENAGYLVLKTTERAGHTVKPTKFRTLRRWYPRLRAHRR